MIRPWRKSVSHQKWKLLGDINEKLRRIVFSENVCNKCIHPTCSAYLMTLPSLNVGRLWIWQKWHYVTPEVRWQKTIQALPSSLQTLPLEFSHLAIRRGAQAPRLQPQEPQLAARATLAALGWSSLRWGRSAPGKLPHQCHDKQGPILPDSAQNPDSWAK